MDLSASKASGWNYWKEQQLQREEEEDDDAAAAAAAASAIDTSLFSISSQIGNWKEKSAGAGF